MTEKITKITDYDLTNFNKYMGSLNSCATLCYPGIYPVELKNLGIKERNSSTNDLVGYIATKYCGTQLAFETVFFDKKEGRDNGDLHLVNLGKMEIKSFYHGWGTCVDYYGDNHNKPKDFLR